VNLIFLGPPGAGKGTLAVHAAPLLAVPHISTGSIFRAAISAKTPLGIKVKSIIDSGGLVDDGTTIALVKERLACKDAVSGYILDGFPRTIPQAEALAGFSKVERVVNFEIPDEVVISRLSGRLVCRKCGFNWHDKFNPPKTAKFCDHCGGEVYTRDDDKPEAISFRLGVYREQTAPLINFYKKAGLIVNLDAGQNVEQMLAEFKKTFNIGC
jgi:adenylate kinase